METRDTQLELEELLLKESIVSVTGLTSNSLQIGIKGDPSMRETTFDRERYCSVVDNFYDEIAPHLQELLLNRSTYRLYIGFNNGEIRTSSIFDPLREEIHSAERMLDHAYLERQFPDLEYTDKVNLIHNLYTSLENSEFYKLLPDAWRGILSRRNAAWKPMAIEHIKSIMTTLDKLRDIQQYYLRNASICIVQDLVRLQFNCDGTQIINAENYRKFLQENLS